MTTTSWRIARIKVDALEQQHALLSARYDAICAEADACQTPREELRALYDGLRRLKFALREVHNEVVNLEALLHLAPSEDAEDSPLLRTWCGRLRRELSRGQARAHHTLALGALLEDWVAPGKAEVVSEEEGRRESEAWGEDLRRPSPQPEHLERLFVPFAAELAELGARVAHFERGRLLEPVSVDEVRAHLVLLGRNPYKTTAFSNEARTIAANPAQCRECAGALTILVSRFETWTWPPEGVPLAARWVRDRWRNFLDDELLDQLFLSIVGMRWAMFFKQELPRVAPFALDAPEQDRDAYSVAARRQHSHAELWMPSVPMSLSEMAHDQRSQAEHYDVVSNQDVEADSMQRLLILVGAELDLMRSSSPGGVVVVGRTDIKDFFPSISHELVLFLVRRLGVSAAWTRFVGRWLEVVVSVEGEVREVTRGVPLDHTLSVLVGELVMRLMESWVARDTSVRLMRFMDDVFFVAPDPDSASAVWAAIGAFCRAAGLELNLNKSGITQLDAVGDASRADTPSGDESGDLPSTPVRWGFLLLETDGDWRVDRARLDAFEVRLHKRLSSAELSIMGAIAIYNSYLRYLLRGCGLFAYLGETHIESVREAVSGLHRRVLDTLNIAARLGVLMEARFDIRDATTCPSWLYWPGEAGGLELVDPALLIHSFEASRALQRNLTVPGVEHEDADRERRHNAWYAFYLARLEGVVPVRPIRTSGLTNLLGDYQEQVLGSPAGPIESKLSPYREWLVAIWGMTFVETFGAPGALLSDIVPTELIARGRASAASADKGMREEVAEGFGVPFGNSSWSASVTDDDDIPF